MSKSRGAGGGAGHCLIWTFHSRLLRDRVRTQSSCDVSRRLSSTVTCWNVLLQTTACARGERPHVHVLNQSHGTDALVKPFCFTSSHRVVRWMVPDRDQLPVCSDPLPLLEFPQTDTRRSWRWRLCPYMVIYVTHMSHPPI